MDPRDIAARAHAAAGRRGRRPVDPDRDRLAHRDPWPTIREHDGDHALFLGQGKGLVADAMRHGVLYGRCRPHHDLFLVSMARCRARYVLACRAWASGATDHLPPPVADSDPVLDLADALDGEINLR